MNWITKIKRKYKSTRERKHREQCIKKHNPARSKQKQEKRGTKRNPNLIKTTMKLRKSYLLAYTAHILNSFCP